MKINNTTKNQADFANFILDTISMSYCTHSVTFSTQAKGIDLDNEAFQRISKLSIVGKLSLCSVEERSKGTIENQLETQIGFAEKLLQNFCDYLSSFNVLNDAGFQNILQKWSEKVITQIKNGKFL